MKVEVKAEVYPSEDPEKVIEAIRNVFPSIEINFKGNCLVGKSKNLESLKNLKNKLGLQAIRDTARRKLRKGKKGNSIRFSLNKQTATVGKVNFSDDETPLGPIEVKIEAKNADELIDYLAPSREQRKS